MSGCHKALCGGGAKGPHFFFGLIHLSGLCWAMTKLSSTSDKVYAASGKACRRLVFVVRILRADQKNVTFGEHSDDLVLRPLIVMSAPVRWKKGTEHGHITPSTTTAECRWFSSSVKERPPRPWSRPFKIGRRSTWTVAWSFNLAITHVDTFGEGTGREVHRRHESSNQGDRRHSA